MWSYYGAKTNIITAYPAPKHDKIIEPFAGSARYALKYFDRDILLMDKYEVVIKMWKWLQQCSPADILKLPRKFTAGQTLDEFTFDCDEAKLLMGFLIGKGGERPRNKVVDRISIDRPNFTNFSLKRIASNLFKIKHWDIRLGSYEQIDNQKATWFIDPPYQFGGHVYPESNKKLNFADLAVWSRGRLGQVIICENMKADWMDFKPLVKQKGTSASMQREAIWSNEKTAFDNQQLACL